MHSLPIVNVGLLQRTLFSPFFFFKFLKVYSMRATRGVSNSKQNKLVTVSPVITQPTKQTKWLVENFSSQIGKTSDSAVM